MGKPAATPESAALDREELAPLYNVVLLDDNDHTYDYVVEMLQNLFYVSFEQAFRHAQEVDPPAPRLLITSPLPQAEFARYQIHAYGPDRRLARSKGSMSAVIEPA